MDMSMEVCVNASSTASRCERATLWNVCRCSISAQSVTSIPPKCRRSRSRPRSSRDDEATGSPLSSPAEFMRN